MSAQIGYLSSAFRGVSEIPKVRTITAPEPDVDEVDVTTLKSANRIKETVPGFITLGEVGLECVSDVSEAVQNQIEVDYLAGLVDPEAWSYKIANTTTGAILRTYSFNGFIKKATRGPISPTEAIMFNIQIKTSGAITIT